MNDRGNLIIKAELRWNLVPIIASIDEGNYKRIVFIKRHELKTVQEHFGNRLHVWRFDDDED